jgi:purine-binding chemotaxis protein CheW
MRSLVTCSIGPHFLAIDVTYVREIVRPTHITPVPGAAHALAGLLNLRGHVLTIIDMATCLGDRFEVPLAERKILVLRKHDDLPVHLRGAANTTPLANSDSAGLLVDAIGDIVDVEEEAIEPPPANLPMGHLPFITAVTEVNGALHAVADISLFLSWDELT